MTSTIQNLIERRKIQMTATRVDRNPNMENENMDHWRCTLRSDSGARIQIVFSMGLGHNGKNPSASDVLDCLASDASGIENARDFADWCSEYGYDTDSRKAEKTFKTCQRQVDALKRLLGHDYQTLLFETERL